MQFINFIDDNTALIVQVTIPVSTELCSVTLAYRKTRCVEIWSHLLILRGKERERAVIHAPCLWNSVSQNVFLIYFRSYLMKKYELHLTFSILIILSAPDRDCAAACCAKPLTAGASSALDRFLRSAFLETADQTSQRDYRPIMIGSW